MRKHIILIVAACLVITVACLGKPDGAAAAAAHTGLTWQSASMCLTCHDAQARDLHGSAHYQWQGQALYATNGPALQGKLQTAFNSYCINILGNWNACGSCHVGLGAKPEPTVSQTQLENLDCLVCHQKDYKRKKVNGVFTPDTAAMTITMDQAVQATHLPTRANCLQCHAKGGGGDNNKRGDMSLAHANTADRAFDVHMATTGANLSCQSCHTTQNHHIAGRGSDLRQTDLDVKMSCTTCHPTKATSTGHATTDVNKHVGRVACQTCHISAYARNASDTAANESTETHRNWAIPEWSAALSRWEPTITRGNDLKPAYGFWNGYSWNYSLNEVAQIDTTTGRYATSRPVGGINDPGSKLFPFKYKTALQPIADSLGVLIAVDTAVYFSTGSYDSAVQSGLVNMGYSGTTPYRNVETDTYQLITHEVRPGANALTCTQCHTSSATQMNLKGMGYAMKGTQSTTCTQCHGQKSMPSYTSLHNKHVNSERYDCAWCHNFSRRERGLKAAPGTPPPADTSAPAVTAFSIPSASSSLTVAITTFTATDNVGVTGYLLTQTSAKPSATAAGWTSAKPAGYAFTSAGAKTLYAWAKDAAGNVSNSLSGTVTITLPPVSDTTAPSVTAFDIPASSTTLTVAITTLTATDNVGVTGYMTTESSTRPAATASGWASSRPASYTFSSAGSKTLYAWARDAAGNVSSGRSDTTTITLPSGTADISTATSLNFGDTSRDSTKRRSLAVKNTGTGALSVSRVEIVGTDAARFGVSTSGFPVAAGGQYSLSVSFRPTAKRSYTATLRIYSNDPDTPVRSVTLQGRGVSGGD